MPVTWSAYLKNPEGFTTSDIQVVLKHLPPDVLAHIQTKVIPLIAAQRIQAIKAMREYTNFGLKMAKELVDIIADGATLNSCRMANPNLIDVIEIVENYLREAIRKATYDEKTMAALIGIRQQVSDLWMELVELPVDPEAKKD